MADAFSSKLATIDTDWERIGAIEGFFGKSQYMVWRWFDDFQKRNGIGGHLGETGVWKGRSAAALTLMRTGSELIHLCDKIIAHTNAMDNLRNGGFETSMCIVHDQPSEELVLPTRVMRWFHVDGDHSVARTYGDLATADAALNNGGVICMDDFFTPRYVGVVFATFRYLQTHPDLKLLLVGDNKGYLCRPEHFTLYREGIMRELPEVLKAAKSPLGLHQPYSIFDCETLGLETKWEPDRYLFGFDHQHDIVETMNVVHRDKR